MRGGIAETKFSDANGDRKISVFIFPVQLTTSRIDNLLTRLIHTALAICITIHTCILHTAIIVGVEKIRTY